MKPSRVPGWPELLADYIEAARGRPFGLGVHDCGSFAREWVRLAWGGAGAGLFDGIEYAGERAACALWALGIEALLSARLGAPVAPLAAQRGDLVAHPYGRVAVGDIAAAAMRAAESDNAAVAAAPGEQTRQRIGIGICLGAQFAAPGADGLVFLPLHEARCGWRV